MKSKVGDKYWSLQANVGDLDSVSIFQVNSAMKMQPKICVGEEMPRCVLHT